MLKKISVKRIKTEADYEELARIEWYAGLYLQKTKIILPSFILEATLLNAGKKIRMGQQVKAGLFIEEHALLHYDGEELSVDELWEQGNHRLSSIVRIGQAKVIRTRPIFNNWNTEFVITFDDELLDADQVIEIVKKAGEVVGFCDWRPKYGRFQIL
jgi:hypothetical protein